MKVPLSSLMDCGAEKEMETSLLSSEGVWQGAVFVTCSYSLPSFHKTALKINHSPVREA